MTLINDPVGDMLTRIRNGHMRSKSYIVCPASKMRVSVLKVLQECGYIGEFINQNSDNNKPELKINLKYYSNQSVIKHIKRISKPGRHLYCQSKNIPRCYNGLGIVILSTSSGVMSDHKARIQNIGGEIFCEVF